MNSRQNSLRRSEVVLVELECLLRDVGKARTYFAAESKPIEMTSTDFDRIARVISKAICRIEELKFEAERLREDRLSFSRFTEEGSNG